MDTSAITSAFFKVIGETRAELKSRTLSRIDLDLLKLKRDMLNEKLEDFKRELENMVKVEKGRAKQNLISRGLSNSSIQDTTLRAIENDAAEQLHKALREHNFALEEIALHERKIHVETDSLIKRFLRLVGI